MAEKNYRAKSVLEREKQIESVIKNIILLIQKGKKSEAKEKLLIEVTKESVSTHIYKRKMYVILGLIDLSDGLTEEAERYFMKALKKRTAYGKEYIEKKIFLASYAGLAIHFGRKYELEKNKEKKDVIRIKAQVYSELMIRNVNLAKNGEMEELLKHIYTFLPKDLRGDNRSQKIRDFENINIVQLVEILND